MNASLTIGGVTFHEGDQVQTPRGVGTVIGLDPFGDREIGVRLERTDLVWFSFRELATRDIDTMTCEACGRPTGIRANGVGVCCWGKDE